MLLQIFDKNLNYGFDGSLNLIICVFSDSRLPAERDDTEKVDKEMERTVKWHKMYINWDKNYKGDSASVS